MDVNWIESPPDRLRSEIVVIGSGPGGAVAASLFAEAGRDVLVIEEGRYLPLESCRPFTREEIEQKYRNGGITVTMGPAQIAYAEGRCVGGGSEVNSGLYHRTPPEILEQWSRRFDVNALTAEDLRPHFEACERDISVGRSPGPLPAASLKLHEGACRLGWKSMEVPRWFRYQTNPSSENPSDGTKQSMTKTYIRRATTAGARLLPQTRALRLVRHTERWSIRAEHRRPDGSVRHVEIEAPTVIVACGAVHTPALLRRSGITRNVGDALHMHPTIKVVARFPDEVNAADMGVPVHQVKEFAPRFSFGCSISSPTFLALALADYPDGGAEVLRNWRRMAVYYAMIGGGRGSVRTVPFHRDPLVRFRLSPADLSDLTAALRKLCQCLFAAGAEALYPSLARGCGTVLTQEADLPTLPTLLSLPQTNLMTIHLFSSCPMGENHRMCAVDSFGKVHGTDGLYVADGSLLCGPPGVNPQGSIMALVRRNALRFLESH